MSGWHGQGHENLKLGTRGEKLGTRVENFPIFYFFYLYFILYFRARERERERTHEASIETMGKGRKSLVRGMEAWELEQTFAIPAKTVYSF